MNINPATFAMTYLDTYAMAQTDDGWQFLVNHASASTPDWQVKSTGSPRKIFRMMAKKIGIL